MNYGTGLSMLFDPMQAGIDYDKAENESYYKVYANVTMPICIEVRAKNQEDAIDKVMANDYDKSEDIEYLYRGIEIEEIIKVEED